MHFRLVFDHVLLDNQVKKDSKRVYDNFLKDCQMQAYYDLSYVQYIEQLIDDLIIIQDNLGLTYKDESHSMYGKNPHASDKSLVTDLVFTSCVDTVVAPESVSSCHRHHDPDIRD